MMKINKIHIISFGGLKNYTLNLGDGFNCIYGENEKGKTTIMSFIKMMFYGNEKGGSQLSKNIRKKYTPWDSNLMAGSIEFEKDGRAYRLEREFKSSNSTDKVSITDLSLGEKRPASATIGEELFGLSASAFERSFFIGQLGFPESNVSAESELNAKLSNMVSTGDESVSLDEVVSKLEKVRHSIISKSGKAGEYYKNSITAKNLKEKLDESITANNRFLEGKEKLTLYKSETEKIIQKAYSLKQQLSKEEDIKNAEKLRELLKTKETLEALKKESTLKNGSTADDNFLRNLKFLSAKFENAKAKREAKEKEAEIIKNQLDVLINGPKISVDESSESIENTLQQLYTNLESVETSQKENTIRLETLNFSKDDKKKSITPLSIIGIVLIILGALGIIISPVITAVLGVLGVVLLVLGLTLKSNKKGELIKQEIASLENVIKNQQLHIDDIKSQIADKKAKIEAIKLANTSNAQIVSAQQNLLL
ncbi:MAG: AAA family ATPase, partial [Clostridia bacterium]|nr:AAA family ATPase [Clostridia bacterium]